MISAIATLAVLVAILRFAFGLPLLKRPVWMLNLPLSPPLSLRREPAKPGLLLTGLAAASSTFALGNAQIGSTLVLVGVVALGFVYAHSLTTTFVAVAGSVATLDTLADGRCVDRPNLTLMVIVTVALLMVVLAFAAVWLVRSISSRHSFGTWALAAFAGFDFISFSLAPGGYAFAEANLGDGAIVALVIALMALTFGLVLNPKLVAPAAGAALTVLHLAIETIGVNCGPSSGLVLLYVVLLTVIVTLLPKSGWL